MYVFQSQRHKRGFTLFYAMLISSLLLAIGLAIFNITYKEYLLTSGIRDSEGAFYAADSALECALYWDYVHEGSSAPAFGFYGDSLASGLVGYWRFEETPTNYDKAFDSSGQGNEGTVEPSELAGATRGAGEVGNALLFNGTDTYMNVAGISGLSLNNKNEEHTISAWVKIDSFPDAFSGPEWILYVGEPGYTSGVHRWTVGFKGALTIDDGGSTYTISPGMGINLGEWTHIAVTYDNSDLILYINGSEIKNGTISSSGIFGNMHGIQPLSLGLNVDGNGEKLNGALDDVRIYNRALSGTEIQKMVAGESNNVFVEPVGEASDGIVLRCADNVINDPADGWDSSAGWDRVISNPNDGEYYSTTVFDVSFGQTCASVDVLKGVREGVSSTTIVARGYNTCDLNSPRRLERALRARY